MPSASTAPTTAPAAPRRRVPAWTQVLFPIGSLVLDAATGYSAGREANPAVPNAPAYFARQGFTHLALSAAMTGGYHRLGAINVAGRVEYDVQVGWDPQTM